MSQPISANTWLAAWSSVALCSLFLSPYLVLGASSLAASSTISSTKAGDAVDLSKVRSSVKCVEEPGNPLYKMCTYHNILVYGLDVIYLSDEPVELPKFDVTWLEITDDYKLMHVKVMSHAELALLPDVQVERINQAAFWFFGSADNYYHCLGEYLPQLHHLVCTLLGLCTYDPAADLRIFRLNQAHAPGSQPLPASIDTALKCLSPDPVLHLGHAAYHNKAFLVSKGVAGIGSECRAFHWCDDHFGRRPLNHASMEGFRNRLAQSIGWDSSAVVPQSPMRIVIFDRKLESRRALLNVALVEGAIRARHPDAEVQTVYGEDLDFEQQVQATASASIFIQMHGASLANWLFLPKGAVGIHIVADPGYAALHHWIREYVRDLPQAPHLLEVTNADPWRMHLVPSAILYDDTYQQLPEQQQRDFWSMKECPAEPQHAADKCRQVWLVKWMNLDINIGQLMGYVDQGVDFVRSFQPPALPQQQDVLETIGLASAGTSPAALQPNKTRPQTVSLTSTISGMPGMREPFLQLPGGNEEALAGGNEEIAERQPSNLGLTNIAHLFGAADDHDGLQEGNAASEVQDQPAAGTLSAANAASSGLLAGRVNAAEVSNHAGNQGMQDVNARESLPRAMTEKELKGRALRSGARKPLPRTHGTSSTSSPGFTALKGRLVSTRKSQSA